MDKKKLVKRILLVVSVAALYAGVVGVHLYRNNLDTEMVVIEENWDEDVPLAEAPGGIDSTTLLKETLSNVPTTITSKMIQDGWSFNITNENLGKKYLKGKSENVLSVTDSRIKTIWLYNTERAIKTCAIHEMGHYIDYSLGYIDRSETFQKIYNAEKEAFVVEGGTSTQAQSSSMEYFAEAFQEALLHPTTLKKSAPQTYEYMQDVIEKFR